jgi:hypothetical protein
MDKTILRIFPYRQNPEGQFFPVIPLRLHTKTKALDTSALVDSGATVSIFRADVAQSLGLRIEDGKEIYLGGVGGRIKGYLHKLPIEIAGKKFLCPIVFSYEYLVSLNLLGREEFFKRFRIIFEEKENLLKLKSY